MEAILAVNLTYWGKGASTEELSLIGSWACLWRRFLDFSRLEETIPKHAGFAVSKRQLNCEAGADQSASSPVFAA